MSHLTKLSVFKLI